MSEPFSAGRVLSRSLSVWLQNFLPFSVLALVCYAPVLLYAALGDSETTAPVSTGSQLMLSMLELALQNVLTGATAFGVFQALRGQPAGLGQAIAVGLRRLLPVLGVALLSGLLTIAGLFLLIVPGIVVLTMVYVAVPVATIERLGVSRSLTRSAELTAGHRWSVLGVFVLTFLAAMLVQLVVANLVGGEEGQVSWPLTLVGVLMMSFGAVTHSVAYHDLRMSKEGAGADELAKVFD